MFKKIETYLSIIIVLSFAIIPFFLYKNDTINIVLLSILCLVWVLLLIFLTVYFTKKRIYKQTDEFLASVCHDLRTPLTGICGFADAIKDGTVSKDKHNHYLNVISDEANRLSRIVNNLLDISRINSGKTVFQKEMFDICETLRLVLISMESKIEQKNLQVTFDFENENSYVFANKDAIHQVVYNLCDNAVKFCNDNGSLALKVSGNSSKYVISVYNSGSGISEEDQKQIFGKFFKAKDTASINKSGVGLGLYIVKSIIDIHNESIFVKSDCGKDCEFVFTLSKAKVKE